MKKICLLLQCIILIQYASASVNYWVGAGPNTNWSNAGNWSNGTPAVTDTVFFDAANASVIVDVNPNIAGLQVVNNSTVIFSSFGSVLITIGNVGTSGLLVFKVASGCSLTIEGKQPSNGVSIQTYGNFTTTKASIEGTFILGNYASTWNLNSFPSSFCTTDITGTVSVASANTGSVISGGLSNGNPGTITFRAGALLNWERSGGSAPNANFSDGSLIQVQGIAGTNMNFNSSAIYNGLLIWDCALQTISGSSAILLPATNTAMDSVRIVNTGTGSLRMATNPNGYRINWLEVNGGILELSAPNSNTNNLSDTIANELKITGGLVYGNATFNFDNLGSAYPNTLVIKGSLNITGGVLDFTNRTSGNAPGGAFAMRVNGDVSQTGGRIKSTKGFDAQNLFVLSGTAMQNILLSNITDTITLVVNNSAGASLQGPLALPYKLLLQNGYLQLNQHNATLQAGRVAQAAVSPTPAVVTNGNGKLVVANVTGAQNFPVAPFYPGYNPVTVTNTGVANTYSARVSYGIQPGGNIDPVKAIYRTWNISSSAPVANQTTALSFQYSDTDKVAGATVLPNAAMLLAHFTSRWGYDPLIPAIPTAVSGRYIVGPFSPSSLDSSFAIGNAGYVSGTYIFTGTGNWSIPANWDNGLVPPNPLPAGNEIIIDPSAGSCTLDVPQSLSPGALLRVNENKNFIVPAIF